MGIENCIPALLEGKLKIRKLNSRFTGTGIGHCNSRESTGTETGIIQRETGIPAHPCLAWAHSYYFQGDIVKCRVEKLGTVVNKVV